MGGGKKYRKEDKEEEEKRRRGIQNVFILRNERSVRS
jgi:hypothetical protein